MTHTFPEIAKLHALLASGGDQLYLVGLRRIDSGSATPTYGYAATDWHGTILAWQGWFIPTDLSAEPCPAYALGGDPLWSSTNPPLLALLRSNAPWMFTNVGEFFTYESTPEEIVGNLLSTHFGDVEYDGTLVDAMAVAAVPLKCPSALSSRLQIRHSEAAALPLGMTRRWAGRPSAQAEKDLHSRLSAVGAWPDDWNRP